MAVVPNLIFILSILYILGRFNCLLINDPNAMNDRILELERKVQALTSQMEKQTGNGAVYIRWGRKTCPTQGTDLVYTGITGGGMYNKKGAAAEYVCLPHDPNLITNVTAANPYGLTTHIYGAEYEDNLLGYKVFDHDVPCAVCHTKSNSIFMVPGKNICMEGWKLEYNGKLASGFEGEDAASQYACVDRSPEILERGGANQNGKLFYPVKAACGSLPCPPYVNDAFLTCVVCSK